MERKRTALVTGGAKGIGAATVKELAAKGFNLIIGYNNSTEKAQKLTAELNSAGVACIAVKADLSDMSQAAEMYKKCKKMFGFVDTVVNNAGTSLIRLLCDCDESDYKKITDDNFKSVYNVCRVFSADMVSEGFGRIVNISSMWGRLGASMETLYSASKAAIIGFTKALNFELAPNGVIVNCVSPGIIDTDMNASLSNDEKISFTERVSLGRMGKADEVAQVIELLTRKKLYIAGAEIAVDGGIL